MHCSASALRRVTCQWRQLRSTRGSLAMNSTSKLRGKSSPQDLHCWSVPKPQDEPVARLQISRAGYPTGRPGRARICLDSLIRQVMSFEQTSCVDGLKREDNRSDNSWLKGESSMLWLKLLKAILRTR